MRRPMSNSLAGFFRWWSRIFLRVSILRLFIGPLFLILILLVWRLFGSRAGFRSSCYFFLFVQCGGVDRLFHTIIFYQESNKRHSSAQCLHSVAHSLQWSCSCFSHSIAQDSQISAHKGKSENTNGLCMESSSAIDLQIVEHSISNWMQFRIWCRCSSFKQLAAQ